MRLISCFELKQKLLEERKKIYRMGGETTFGQATIHGIRIALRLMDQCLPQGEVVPVAVPVVHGRWVKQGHYPPECSVCGGIAPKDCEGEEFYQSDFCQSCGADMRERAVEGAGPYKEQNEMDRRQAWIKLQRRCSMRLIKENVQTGELSTICLAEHDGVEMHATHWSCDMKRCPGLEEFTEAVIMGVEE